MKITRSRQVGLLHNDQSFHAHIEDVELSSQGLQHHMWCVRPGFTTGSIDTSEMGAIKAIADELSDLCQEEYTPSQRPNHGDVANVPNGKFLKNKTQFVLLS